MVIVTSKFYCKTLYCFTGKVIYNDRVRFIKNDVDHRYYGPARIWVTGYRAWWFNNKTYGNSFYGYSQKQFLKNINKQWLY